MEERKRKSEEAVGKYVAELFSIGGLGQRERVHSTAGQDMSRPIASYQYCGDDRSSLRSYPADSQVIQLDLPGQIVI